MGGSNTVNSAGLIGGIASGGNSSLDNMDSLSTGLPGSGSVESTSVSQDANSLEAFGASGPWGASGHSGLAQVEESKPQDTSNNVSDMNNNNNGGGPRNGHGFPFHMFNRGRGGGGGGRTFHFKFG